MTQPWDEIYRATLWSDAEWATVKEAYDLIFNANQKKLAVLQTHGARFMVARRNCGNILVGEALSSGFSGDIVDCTTGLAVGRINSPLLVEIFSNPRPYAAEEKA